MGFFSGSKQQVNKLDLLTPEQKELLNKTISAAGMNIEDLFGEGSHVADSEAYQKGMGALSDMLGQFDPTRIQEAFQSGVADPARQAFMEQTVPGITERFAGSGGMRSSAYTGQLAREGQNLESGLAGTLSNMLMQGEQAHNQLKSGAINQALQYSLAPEEEKKNLMALLQQGLGTQAFQNQIIPAKSNPFHGPLTAALFGTNYSTDPSYRSGGGMPGGFGG